MKDVLAKKAAEVLDNKEIIVIATAGDNDQPWNTPVAGFRFPGDLTFYWTSWTQNQHSKNIRANNKVFIVIFDETAAEGVYFLAEAYELNDEQEVETAAKVFGENNKFCPSEGSEYMDSKPRRIYKAIPKQAWMNADKRDEAGKFIHDYREEVDLNVLRASVK